MRGRLRRVVMGFCLHVLLSGFLLAGFQVYRSGYAHMHRAPAEPVGLAVTGDSVTVSVMEHALTLPLPAPDTRLVLSGLSLADQNLLFWALILDIFIK